MELGWGVFLNIFSGICRPYHLQGLHSESGLYLLLYGNDGLIPYRGFADVRPGEVTHGIIQADDSSGECGMCGGGVCVGGGGGKRVCVHVCVSMSVTELKHQMQDSAQSTV